VLGQLAAERGMPFVCVQPMQTSWARRGEDLTSDDGVDPPNTGPGDFPGGEIRGQIK
jgi:hypothetical protein